MHGQKRIMVTGGTGFLGSFLCERLLREGNDVLAVDNYYTGSRDNVLHLRDTALRRRHGRSLGGRVN